MKENYSNWKKIDENKCKLKLESGGEMTDDR